MKPFEIAYLFLEPFLPALRRQVRKRLLRIAKAYPIRPKLLDVGARKSQYTIGVPADVTITDLPRKTEIQSKLNLGINDRIIQQLYARRSNVRQILYDDMTCSSLPDNSFDCVVAVEVLEHVEKDDLFVEQVYRVLTPGGVFLMTTPNGDFVSNTNPDHVRHYTKEQLTAKLSRCFVNVHVEYAVRDGFFYERSQKSWSVEKPFQTILSMVGAFINQIQSGQAAIKHQSEGTRHLFALAYKPGCVSPGAEQCSQMNFAF